MTRLPNPQCTSDSRSLQWRTRSRCNIPGRTSEANRGCDRNAPGRKICPKKLVRGHLQSAIEAQFEVRALVQLEVALAEHAFARAEAAADCGANARSLAAAKDQAAQSACAGAFCGVLDHVTLGVALALDFAFRAVGNAVLAGNAVDAGDERHPAVVSFDFVEAEQHVGMEAAVGAADVAANFLAAGNDG